MFKGEEPSMASGGCRWPSCFFHLIVSKLRAFFLPHCDMLWTPEGEVPTQKADNQLMQ